MTYDAIVVLGGGVNYDGTINEISKYKVDLAVKLFKSRLAPRMIMSTKWSGFLPKKPKLTEAEAMKRHAIKSGVLATVVFKEEESMDTIGNAIFVKQNFLMPNDWKKIIVVTSDFHMPRTKYIFQKVMGQEYKMSFKKAESSADGKIPEERTKTEERLFAFTKIFLDDIPDGSDHLIKELLLLAHPFYSEVWKELIQMLDEDLAKALKKNVEVAKLYKEFIKDLSLVPKNLYEFGGK